MKTTLLVSALSLSLASARTLFPRQITTPVIPSYTLTVTTTSNPAGTQLSSDANGNIFTAFNAPDFLVSATIANQNDDAQCVARDAQGNQVRAFGGPQQDVDSIVLVEADGKQVATLSCTPFTG